MSGVLHGVIASLAGRVTDAFWKYVTLLLNTTSTNGAQNNTFLDSSTNNFSITRNGDTTQGSFNPYMPSGYWSGFFDGTGDYLTAPANAAFQFGTGNFTIEFWYYPTAFVDYNTPIDMGYLNSGSYVIQNGTAGQPYFFLGPSTTLFTSATAYTLNAWNHLAVVRSGTNTSMYLNGTRVGNATSSANINANFPLGIGGSPTHSVPVVVAGYLSNVRLVKGTAVYDPALTTLTVPTAPLTAITNTSLLCLQDNRFIDNSTNAFAITVNGDTRISKFAPFNPPASYSTASYGGSGYFDGVGDYLSVPRNNAFLPGANTDFTVEAWVYLTATPGATDALIAGFGEYGQDSDWNFNINSSRQLTFYINAITTQFTNTGTLVSLNTWTHVAASRSGTGTNNLKVFVNGVGQSFTTNSTTVGTGSRNLTIGADQNGDESNLTGYISNLRFVTGTGVYTTDFTPPTTPLTAITNTSLLLNFTNAGIFDAATINNGQTVGNAQVSTTQSKWSPTSMSFDGTGDEVSIVAKPELRFGTAPFTVEMWVYCTNAASGATQDLVGNLTNVAGDTNWHFSISSTAVLQAGTYNNVLANSGAATLSSTTWTHVAFTFDGTTYRVFINGTVGTTTSTTVRNLSDSTSAIKVGNTNFGGRLFNGYIQDLRITNGVARYTANFTAPTAAFPTL